jgi:oligopeptidase B
MKTKKRKLIKQENVKGGYVESDYLTKRLYAKSRDGKKIPISIVYNRKKYNKNGPLLLWGYGSYGATYDPWFSSSRLSLLDRGFAFAIAHIRGSKIYDESWYENGKLLKKINTFNDFIDCSKYLISCNYTSIGNLYAIGGSAGGLLMGAIANMRSDLFNGIVAEVPFVDVINTMLDETIPLTTGEYDEWGNPNIKKYFDYMLTYSPYNNVVKKEYANLLVTSGFHDSQVQYWEPLKWVAKLRSCKVGDSLLLLDMDMDSGHGGATGRFKPLKKVALNYAFLLYLDKSGNKDNLSRREK